MAFLRSQNEAYLYNILAKYTGMYKIFTFLNFLRLVTRYVLSTGIGDRYIV